MTTLRQLSIHWAIAALAGGAAATAFHHAWPVSKGASAPSGRARPAAVKPIGAAAPARAASPKPRGSGPTREASEATFRDLHDDGAASERRLALQAEMDQLLASVPSSKLHDVECRASTCRVAVVHSEPGAQQLFMAELSEHPPGGFASMRLYQEEGGGAAGESTVFLTVSVERSEEADEEPARELDDVARAFAGEAADAAWAAPTARSLEAALTQLLGGGSSLDGVECRRTTCRVTVTHSSPAERDRFLSAYSEKPFPDVSGALMYPLEEGDALRTVLFVSRAREAS